MRARSIASQKELVNIIESKEGSRRIYGNVHSLTIIHLSINHQPVNIRPSIKQTHPLTCQSKNHLPGQSVSQKITYQSSQSIKYHLPVWSLNQKSLTSPVSQ